MITDFFHECQKIEKRTVSDGLGGYETVYYYGITFQGLSTKLSTQEQVVGALRGKEETQNRFYTYENVPLQKDDIIAYAEPADTQQITKFIRLTSNKNTNPIESMQEDWVEYDAEDYTPSNILQG